MKITNSPIYVFLQSIFPHLVLRRKHGEVLSKGLTQPGHCCKTRSAGHARLGTCHLLGTNPSPHGGTVRARGGGRRGGRRRGHRRGCLWAVRSASHRRRAWPTVDAEFPGPAGCWPSRHHCSLWRGSLPGRFRACSGVSPRISSPPSSSGF